jgi:hypothetical protein
MFILSLLLGNTKKLCGVFFAGILVLKCATILVHKSLNPLIEFGFKLLYQTCIDPLKVVGVSCTLSHSIG